MFFSSEIGSCVVAAVTVSCSIIGAAGEGAGSSMGLLAEMTSMTSLVSPDEEEESSSPEDFGFSVTAGKLG
jgi:hypothetical protein